MPTASRMGNVAEELEATTEKLRINSDFTFPNKKRKNSPSDEYSDDDQDDEEYQDDYENSSVGVGNDGADTPATPFSPGPGRKKFPSELKTIKCTYEGCPKTFNRPARLAAHIRSHTNERPFVCTYEGCGKAYLEDKHLQHHIKGSHTKEREFTCDWEGCGKSFLTSTRLKRHKEAHKGHDRFRCTNYPPCNQFFRKHQTLQRHIRSDHQGLTPFPCTYVNPLTGEACGAGFDGVTGLRQHQEREHGAPRFFCEECIVPNCFNPDGSPMHLGFVSNAKRQAHIKKEHANCIFCDLKFRSQYELTQHVDNQHSGKSIEEKKKHACTYIGCNKKFTTPNNLNTHTRSAHLGQRYICGTFDLSEHRDCPGFDNEQGCDAELKTKQSLIDHIRTAHLGLDSINNRKRVKHETYSDYDTDDGEDWVPPPPQKKTRKTKNKATIIDHLVGTAQQADGGRTITCPIEGCPHLFMRQYDLQVHLRSLIHNPPPTYQQEEDEQVFEAGFQGYEEQILIDPSLLNHAASARGMGLDDQADIDWELQQRAMEGGQFWVGAEDVCEGQDEWERDASEMKRLIGGRR